MALVVYDRVQETTATTGTGTITLSGAVAGYQSFAVVGNGNTTFYCIVNGAAWEVGIGTYTSVGTTLARTTVLSNSNGNTSPITLSGASNVFITYPSEKSISYDANDVATIGSTLSYSDTGIIGSFASTVAGYNQVIVQNKSAATNASTNLNVSNNAATSSSGYAELGINSSTFSGTGSFNIAGASYLASASTDLTIGTYGAYNVHFVTNSNTTDAMTIYNSGGISLGGYADPGIGTLYANNVYIGFNAITAAAGTTVLTNASAGYQNVTGTTTQTIQLPVATTLYKGLAFTIANASTGNVTIKDSASTTIDTIVTGGTSVLILTANGTSAGTWVAYSYIPAAYDFNNTSASFGSASITNAVWNGTTIASGYGGTGLTTFTAANNAIYSTSASALAAGTLPIAAGGTAATTFTANGVIYGNGTSALGATAAGTTGQVLIGNTGAAPSWGSVPTTAAVTSLNFGTTGLTPASATTGAITVAGTLAAANGGTGQSLYAVGDLLYASTTTALSKLADVATGNALISGGVSTAPSWGKIGLTTHVSGTLPVANGGTNITSYAVGDILYASAAGVLSSLADVATGNVIISGGIGVAPSYGKVGLTTHVSGTLPIANGGTNATTTPTAGGIAYGTGTAYAFTTVGTSGQVLTSAAAGAPTWTTATNANTASAIVQRDGSGNFSAGTITATLSGNASTATTATNQSGGTVAATTGSFSGQITSSVGGAAISFTNATSNYLQFNSGGVAAPTFTTASAGTKIVLYNAVSASSADYAIGITSNTQWYSIPQNNTSYTYSWYAGTTSIATLRGDGLFTAGSFTGAGTGLTGTASSLSIGGNATTATTATTANALNTANSYTVAGLTVNSTGGLKVLSTNNPVVQLVANGGTAATNAALVNNWAAGSNGGVLIGTSEGAGTALQVSSAIAITSGLPSSTGTSLLTVGVSGSTFSTAVTATSFSGAGTGLTGTASSLTVGTATTATNLSGGTVSSTGSTSSGGYTATSAAPFYLNATTVSSNYTSPANYNLMSAGPITINTGVTVTIDTTGTWVIV